MRFVFGAVALAIAFTGFGIAQAEPAKPVPPRSAKAIECSKQAECQGTSRQRTQAVPREVQERSKLR